MYEGDGRRPARPVPSQRLPPGSAHGPGPLRPFRWTGQQSDGGSHWRWDLLGCPGLGLFSSSAGDWKLAFHDYDWIILPLVPVGSAIKETGPVFRPTDPRCVPTGGTRARTWEWDGHTLVAGPWHQVSKGPPPPTTVASTKPLAPCTAKVITAIAKSGVQNFYNVDGFGCSGEFAYAFVTVATPQHRPIAEITVLFMASKGTWHLASRAIYCENRSVPPAIYRTACETN